MYIPEPVEDREHRSGKVLPGDLRARIQGLEGRIEELEGLAEALEGVPDEEVVGVLEKAVALLGEVNDGLESGLEASENEARELGEILDRVDFGPLDEALERAQHPPQPPGESPERG